MNKKIVVLICTLILYGILLPVYPVFAENTDVTEKEEVLKGLGILTEERITRNNFVYALAGFLYDDPYCMGNAEDISELLGFSDEKENSSLFTLDEAIKYAVITLGYKIQVSSESDYRKIATTLRITDGITSNGEKALKQDDAIRLLYNMLDVEPMVKYITSSINYGYRVATGETLLSFRRDIFRISGIMTANSDTSIYEAEGTIDDTVIIDGEAYITSDESQNDFLGMNVIGYVQGRENEDRTLIYVSQKTNKNDILVIDGEDIEDVESDYSKIWYFDENDKLDSADLNDVPRIIFNGIYYGKYTLDDLSPEIGNLEMIDNNKDGKYDIINVTSYETMFVESVDYDDLKIKNKLNYDGCIETLDLEGDGNDIKYSVYNNGGKTDLTSLKQGSVISVAESKTDGDKIVNIYICEKEPFSGTITAFMPKDDTIKIDGELYTISEDFKKYIAAKQMTFNVGLSFEFYTDYFGNIAYVQQLINSDYKLVLKIRKDDDGETCFAEYMDLNEKWTKSCFAKKIVINGETRTALDAYEKLRVYDGDPQVMIIKLNSDGEIRRIDTAIESNLSLENKFTKTPIASYSYQIEPKSLGMKIFLEDTALAFLIPSESLGDKGDYAVINAIGTFGSNKSYMVSAYDIDEFGFTNLLTVTKDANYEKSNVKNRMFVVTRVYKGFFEDEVRPVIQGYMGEYKNMTVVGATLDVYDNVVPGDVINLAVNTKGEATYVKKIVSLEEFTTIPVSRTYESSVLMAGTIEQIDAAKSRIKLNTGSSVVVKINPSTVVQFYDREMKRCETKTALELQRDDEVVMRVAFGVVSEIAAVKR